MNHRYFTRFAEVLFCSDNYCHKSKLSQLIGHSFAAAKHAGSAKPFQSQYCMHMHKCVYCVDDLLPIFRCIINSIGVFRY